MKIRVISKKDFSGKTIFYAQYKNFLFWKYVKEAYKVCFDKFWLVKLRVKEFTTYSDAINYTLNKFE